MSAYEIVKTETVDLGAEAARLENFELSLARQECETLRAEILEMKRAHVDDVSALKHQAEADPVELVLGMLRSIPDLELSLADAVSDAESLREALAEERENNAGISEKLDQVVAAAESACVQRDKAFTDLNRLSREIDVLRSAVRARDADLKELRSLNPKKLNKQVKNLQNRNRELVEIDARNKAVIKELRDSLAEMETVKRHNGELLAALDDACEMINSGDDSARVWEDDTWSLVGHKDATNSMLVEHKPTGIVRLFTLAKGVLQSPPVPAHVVDQARGRLERYSRIDASLDAYKGGC